MSYSPGYSEVVPPMVGPFTFGWSPSAHERIINAAPTSAGWESANRAVYQPILVPTTCVLRRLWWANGATVSASYNVDVGIYLDAGYKPGSRLLSAGSTAQGTASEVQFVNATDTTMAPGLYWVAMTASSVIATFARSSTHATYDAAVRFEEAAALPLPATATPVEASATGLYLCGFATTASP